MILCKSLLLQQCWIDIQSPVECFLFFFEVLRMFCVCMYKKALNKWCPATVVVAIFCLLFHLGLFCRSICYNKQGFEYMVTTALIFYFNTIQSNLFIINFLRIITVLLFHNSNILPIEYVTIRKDFHIVRMIQIKPNQNIFLCL